jgi:hypothetical protein
LPDVVSVEDTTGGKARNVGTSVHSLACKVVADEASLDEVPEDWRDGVQMYVDHVQANEGKFIFEHFWESICIDDFGGTTDTVIINGNKCAVYDFKTGKWPVDAFGNTQLISYCSMIAEHFDVDEFFGVIVQPKPKWGDRVKVAEYTLDMIDAHRERVAIAAVSNHKAVGDHCRFCPLRLTQQCDEGARHARKKGWGG